MVFEIKRCAIRLLNRQSTPLSQILSFISFHHRSSFITELWGYLFLIDLSFALSGLVTMRNLQIIATMRVNSKNLRFLLQIAAHIENTEIFKSKEESCGLSLAQNVTGANFKEASIQGQFVERPERFAVCLPSLFGEESPKGRSCLSDMQIVRTQFLFQFIELTCPLYKHVGNWCIRSTSPFEMPAACCAVRLLCHWCNDDKTFLNKKPEVITISTEAHHLS